jgi:hypothetical protein
MIVDFVFVNNVMWGEGRERGERGEGLKGGAVVTRPEVKVNGNSSPRARDRPSK